MSIVRAGIYSAISAASRLGAGFLVVKLVALFAGPEGVGKMGQFMSVMSLLAVIAGGGIANGVTKYVAEYHNSALNLEALLGTSLSYSVITSVLTSFIAMVFSQELAVIFLSDERYENLIFILAGAQLSVAMHTYFVSIINGLMDVRSIALINFGGAVFSICLTAFLSWKYQLYGALLALILGQAALIFISAPIAWINRQINFSHMRPRLDKVIIKKLFNYSAMTLLSAMLPPVVQILVRGHLSGIYSWDQVGYWQAVSKVSEAYLLFFTMAIGMYYLPKLSSINNGEEFRSELLSAYRVVIPTVILMAVLIYLFRDWILDFLFSPEFLGASYLFFPQMIGDVIKIAAFIQSYVMVAKALTKAFIFSELFFSATYVIFVYVFVDIFGLIGAMYAFCFNYLIYFFYTCGVSRWYIKKMGW